MYTKRYPAETAAAIAEEIGFEACVAIHSAIAIAKSAGANEGHAWELTGVGLAAKAAHFAAMALGSFQPACEICGMLAPATDYTHPTCTRCLALDKDRGIECRD